MVENSEKSWENESRGNSEEEIIEVDCEGRGEGYSKAVVEEVDGNSSVDCSDIRFAFLFLVLNARRVPPL